MKTLITVLSASAILSTLACAEPVKATQQMMEQERTQMHNEVQNRFRNMSTDQLLDQQRIMAQDRDRDRDRDRVRDRDRDLLHKELQNRYRTMTQEQKRKFDQTTPVNHMQQGMGGSGMQQGMGGSGMGGGGKGGR